MVLNNRPVALNGAQSLVTIDGFAIPLDFRNGQTYLNLHPFMDSQFEELPHVIMTRDITWTPSRYDSTPSTGDTWFRQQHNPDPLHPGFNLIGELAGANVNDSINPSILSILHRQGFE